MKTIIATLEWSEDGYGVWFDELPNVFSFGETVEKAQANAREAVEFSFDGVSDAPQWVRDGFNIVVRYDTAMTQYPRLTSEELKKIRKHDFFNDPNFTNAETVLSGEYGEIGTQSREDFQAKAKAWYSTV